MDTHPAPIPHPASCLGIQQTDGRTVPQNIPYPHKRVRRSMCSLIFLSSESPPCYLFLVLGPEHFSELCPHCLLLICL